MSDFTIVIGNKSYSSWSLRGWLPLRVAGAAFSEIVIPLSRPETRSQMQRHCAPGPCRVPVLKHGDLAVWDSFAILEYIAERFPAAGLWPSNAAARATARAVCAEMHAGFADLRTHMPVVLREYRPGRSRTPAVEADIARIEAVWRDCLARFGGDGPYLFGPFSGADIAYAPVVTRFKTYGVELAPDLQAYADAVLAHPAMRDWYAAAADEPWVIDSY